MLPTEESEPILNQTFPDDPGIVHVAVYHSLHLLLPLCRIDRFGSTLDDVGGAVELGGLTPVPEVVKGDISIVSGSGFQFFGNNRVAATQPGEAGTLGK